MLVLTHLVTLEVLHMLKIMQDAIQMLKIAIVLEARTLILLERTKTKHVQTNLKGTTVSFLIVAWIILVVIAF